MKILSRLLVALLLGASLQARAAGAAFDVNHVSVSQWIPVSTSQTLPTTNGGGQLRYECDATAGAVTLTLPTAVLNFNTYELKKVDSSGNACILATTASQTIDGASTKSLTVQYTPTVSVTSDGANWGAAGGSSGGGAGSVTTVSVVSANGLSGTVATATSTPAITLAPTFTGITYSNGTGFAAAVAGNFPTLNQPTTGNAATATALAATPTQCTGSQFATGITALGVANCATPAGSGNVNNTGTPTAGQLAEWTSATVIGGQTMGGDCTFVTATITCTKTSGTGFATSATVDATNATNISSGTLAGARMSAVNLAIATNGGVTGTLPAANLPAALSASTSVNGTTIPAAATLLTSGGALGTPASGTATNLTGLPTTALTGTLQAAQEPAHTGDATNTAGSLALSVKGINGTALSGLATGILKNTTTTGTPSIATSADVIADFTGCSGSMYLGADGACHSASGGGTVTSIAATVPGFLSLTGSPVTTAGTLAIGLSGTALPVANGGTGATAATGTGNAVLATSPTLVTPVLGAATATTINGTSIPATATLLTSGGALGTPSSGSAANLTSFPTLNQSTTGNAATATSATTATNIAGGTARQIPFQSGAGATTFITPASTGYLEWTGSAFTWATPPGTAAGANPTASIGLTANNGSSTAFMRADASPALSQAISPTMTGAWTFNTSTGSQLNITATTATWAEGWNLVDGQVGAHTYGDIAGYCNASAPGTWSLYDYTASASRICVNTNGTVTIPAPASGAALQVNAAASTSGISLGQTTDTSNTLLINSKGAGVTGISLNANGVEAVQLLNNQSGGALLGVPTGAVGIGTIFSDPFVFGNTGGVEVGAPTGGAKGNGTLNAQGLYVNGIPVAGGITRTAYGGWVSCGSQSTPNLNMSCTTFASGVATLNIAAAGFTAPPFCIVQIFTNGTGASGYVDYSTSSSSALHIDTFAGGGTPTNETFSIFCTQ